MWRRTFLKKFELPVKPYCTQLRRDPIYIGSAPQFVFFKNDLPNKGDVKQGKVKDYVVSAREAKEIYPMVKNQSQHLFTNGKQIDRLYNFHTERMPCFSRMLNTIIFFC